MEVYRRLIEFFPDYAYYRRHFVRAVRVWWESLHESARAAQQSDDKMYGKLYSLYIDSVRAIEDATQEDLDKNVEGYLGHNPAPPQDGNSPGPCEDE